MKLNLKLFEFLQMEQGDEISLNARNRDMSGAHFLSKKIAGTLARPLPNLLGREIAQLINYLIILVLNTIKVLCKELTPSRLKGEQCRNTPNYLFL